MSQGEWRRKEPEPPFLKMSVLLVSIWQTDSLFGIQILIWIRIPLWYLVLLWYEQLFSAKYSTSVESAPVGCFCRPPHRHICFDIVPCNHIIGVSLPWFVDPDLNNETVRLNLMFGKSSGSVIQLGISKSARNISLLCSVAEPYHFDTDPDSDPGSIFQ